MFRRWEKTRNIAQSVECLPCNHKDQSSVPRTYITNSGNVAPAYNPNSEELETGKPYAHWTDNEVSFSAPVQWETLPQRAEWTVSEEWHSRLPSGLHMHTHAQPPVRTQSHTCQAHVCKSGDKDEHRHSLMNQMGVTHMNTFTPGIEEQNSSWTEVKRELKILTPHMMELRVIKILKAWKSRLLALAVLTLEKKENIGLLNGRRIEQENCVKE